jgi:hypothetical protein
LDNFILSYSSIKIENLVDDEALQCLEEKDLEKMISQIGVRAKMWKSLVGQRALSNASGYEFVNDESNELAVEILGETDTCLDEGSRETDRSRFSPNWNKFVQIKEWPRAYSIPSFGAIEEKMNVKDGLTSKEMKDVINILFNDLFSVYKCEQLKEN